MIIIDGVVPKKQPTSYAPSRELLGRDGTFAAIEGPLLTYVLDIPIAEPCEYEEWYNLATSGSHTVFIAREDDWLKQEYTGAQVRVTGQTYTNGQVSSMSIEIVVYQPPL